MASQVSIANRALSKLGDDRILQLTDNTKSARTILNMFDDVRDAELRRYRWKFCIKRVGLLALSQPPAFGYARQFPLPDDYLGMVQVGAFMVPATVNKLAKPYSIEAGVVLTNFEAPLYIRYQSRVTNTGLFDPLFVELLACKLAMEACETLTQSGTKYDRCAEQYKFALSEAMRADAIELCPDVLPDGSWIESRGEDYAYAAGTGWQSYPGT